MNMMRKPIKSEPDVVDGRAVLAVLDRRLAELDARRKAVIEEIIALEKGGAGSGPNESSTTVQAEGLLDGATFAVPQAAPPRHLDKLYAERATIDLALKIGNDRKNRLAVEAAGDVYAAHRDELAGIEKRRVLLALELQSVNRARELLREKLAAAGCPGASLATDSVDLLGLGDMDDEVLWAANRLIADGIVTRAEIARAKNG